MSWLTGKSGGDNIWGGVGHALGEAGGAFHSGHGLGGLVSGIGHAANDAQAAAKPITDDIDPIQKGVAGITKNVGDGMTAAKPGLGQISKGFGELGHGGLGGLIAGGKDIVAGGQSGYDAVKDKALPAAGQAAASTANAGGDALNHLGLAGPGGLLGKGGAALNKAFPAPAAPAPVPVPYPNTGAPATPAPATPAPAPAPAAPPPDLIKQGLGELHKGGSATDQATNIAAGVGDLITGGSAKVTDAAGKAPGLGKQIGDGGDQAAKIADQLGLHGLGTGLGKVGHHAADALDAAPGVAKSITDPAAKIGTDVHGLGAPVANGIGGAADTVKDLGGLHGIGDVVKDAGKIGKSGGDVADAGQSILSGGKGLLGDLTGGAKGAGGPLKSMAKGLFSGW